MNSARNVIKKFGGQQALATALGKSQSTVAYWAKAGSIPAKWHTEVLEAAASNGVALDAAELVNVPAHLEVVPEMPTARYEGILTIGDAELTCYVLSDGQRVMSRVSATTALSGVHGGGDLASYIQVESLRPYFPRQLEDELIQFHLDGVTHKKVQGITAETFLNICRAYQGAFNEGQLKTERQKEIARVAGAFLAACARIGLDALIDEATGYQYERAEDALQVKLRAYLEEEMRPWEKTFPDELWKEFGRLTGWKGTIQQRPKYWGKLVNELVYNNLDADVAQWLRENAPKPRHGQNYHQWMSSQYGLKKLLEHLWMLIGMASACDSMDELRHRVALRNGKHMVQMRLAIEPPK
ncbi:MAG: P63C domain-containing protein [Jatrophihabitantaceae bacterium]